MLFEFEIPAGLGIRISDQHQFRIARQAFAQFLEHMNVLANKFGREVFEWPPKFLYDPKRTIDNVIQFSRLIIDWRQNGNRNERMIFADLNMFESVGRQLETDLC